MTINKKLCPEGLKNNPNRPLKSISYITIHNTGNYSPSGTALSHANYQYGGSGGSSTSWHYTIDKDSIWQSFQDEQECWHTATSIGNATSIGLEICVNDKNGFKDACDRAAWLVAELLKKHGLTIDKVVQHNYWSGKNCPEELRSGAWGVSWDGFLALTNEYLNADTELPPVNEPSEWAKESWEWAKTNKITDGTNPKNTATREQVAAMIYNYSKR